MLIDFGLFGNTHPGALMANSQAQEFMDTVQMVSQERGSVAAHASSASSVTTPAEDAEIWPEAADFQCSQSAALFAGTLPAPLTVV